METSSSRIKSNHKHFQRSVSPSGHFCSSLISSYSMSSFSSKPSRFVTRSASPNLRGSVSPSSPSIRFSTSPNRSISFSKQKQCNNSNKPWTGQKKTCMCSPTTHPGSFRCSLHKNVIGGSNHHHQTMSYHSHRLNARRSAMTNSLVRIGTVEGDLVKRALAALIRPSSHQQRRRCDFQSRPSRLSIMSKVEDL